MASRIESGCADALAGLRAEVLERCPSTQTHVIERARAGERAPLAVFAEAQTAGRGRLGRSWASPARVNLYVSILLRTEVPLERLSGVTLGMALAVADALVPVGVEAGIKWPNDLLAGGRKISGILTELVDDVAGASALVIGIGVNLNAERAEFPAELHETATSVALETGQQVDRTRFAALLLAAVGRRWRVLEAGGFAALRPEWETRHVLTGQRVTVAAGESIAGLVRGVDDGGALLVEGPGGVQRVISGEATLRRET